LASNSEEKWIELLNYIDEHSTHQDLEKRLDGSYILMVLMDESPEIFDGF